MNEHVPPSPQPETRKRYSAPKLTEYGHVSALTQSGSVGSAESSGPGSTDPTKRPSEPSLKANIVRVGRHPLGIGLYLFDYAPEWQDEFGASRQFGCMADEVEQVRPDAIVQDPRGFRMVDYAKLGIVFSNH